MQPKRERPSSIAKVTRIYKPDPERQLQACLEMLRRGKPEQPAPEKEAKQSVAAQERAA